MKILVADDDAVSRRLMERMLQRNGYEVVTAENGREAAEILACDSGPRLALIDWMMPELDGPGVCQHLRSRRNTRYIYITLLTSKHSTADIVLGLEAGADDYLIKPCNTEELMARLRTGIRILDLEDKLVEAREDMRFKATHDMLTSLWNRGAVMADFERELARAHREHGAVSILICDIDHFKEVNDVHGHSAGDAVLKQVASCLLDSVRSYDMVARYGGEEFLLVLSRCDSHHAQRCAESIRKAVAERQFESSHGPLSLSVSIGILTSTGWDPNATTAELVNEADQALYRAKKNGRNRVELALPLPNRFLLENESDHAHITS